MIQDWGQFCDLILKLLEVGMLEVGMSLLQVKCLKITSPLTSFHKGNLSPCLRKISVG